MTKIKLWCDKCERIVETVIEDDEQISQFVLDKRHGDDVYRVTESVSLCNECFREYFLWFTKRMKQRMKRA